MTKLSPINFIIGLSTNLNVNNGQNKFKVKASKNVAKIAKFGLKHKIGQLPLCGLARNLLLGITRSFSSDFDVLFLK